MADRFVRLRIPAFDVHYVSDVYPQVREVLGGDELKFEGLGGALLDGIVQDVRVSLRGSEGKRAPCNRNIIQFAKSVRNIF